MVSLKGVFKSSTKGFYARFRVIRILYGSLN